MKVGFGQAEYTPRGGNVSLFGQFELRITEEVLDPLNVVAMVMVSEHARTVWVSVDTIHVCAGNSKEFYEAVCQVIRI